MTRMESWVDGLERDLEGVKGRLKEMDVKVGKLNSQVENVERYMETTKDYFRELREILVNKENAFRDKGKTLMKTKPFMSHTSPMREITPLPLVGIKKPIRAKEIVGKVLGS